MIQSSSMRMCGSRFYGFLLMVFAGLLFTGCRKESFEVEGVTGHTWTVYNLMERGDYMISPMPGKLELTLKSDQSFSFRINGAVSRGTYSWTTVDTTNVYATKAEVKFTIVQMSTPAEYPGIADKMKRVLLGVNTCYVSKHPRSSSSAPAFASGHLHFEGSTGYFYAYR